MTKAAAKPFSHSLTVWLSGILGAIGVAMTQAPELLTSALSFLASDQVRQSLALLSPRAKEAVDAIMQILGALIALFAALNGFIRVAKTNGAVAPPKLPGRKAAAGLLVIFTVATLTACGTGKAIADFNFPDVAAIATPEKAEEILYTGTLAYKFVVGSVNALHDAELFPDAEYKRLVGNDDSVAVKLRDALAKGFELTKKWRESGDRAQFDERYKQIVDAYRDLTATWKRIRGGR